MHEDALHRCLISNDKKTQKDKKYIYHTENKVLQT